MCAVAKNSPEGEKATAVATEGSFNADIRKPVGKSQTRSVESRETDIIQLEVGEKI
jgi:hypothetical protein